MWFEACVLQNIGGMVHLIAADPDPDIFSRGAAPRRAVTRARHITVMSRADLHPIAEIPTGLHDRVAVATTEVEAR